MGHVFLGNVMVFAIMYMPMNFHSSDSSGLIHILLDPKQFHTLPLYANVKCPQETEPEVALLGRGIHAFYCIRAAIVDLNMASYIHTSIESKSSHLLIS